ncbi:MAG: alpha/beta fold hydrolase [Bauldia sp.]|nr:alpha/beta fold hydrolase [Bauldia sp.]
MFLHGNGASGGMWRKHAAALKDYHVLLPDLPGFGASASEAWPSLPEVADAVGDIIRSHAADGKAHIVGLSLGGCVAFQLLARHPKIVDHAVIDGAGVLPIRGVGLLKIGLRLAQPFLHTRLAIRLLARMLHIPSSGFDDFARDLGRMSSSSFTRAFIEALRMGEPPGLLQAAVPTLLVAGEREDHRSSRYLAAVMPHAAAYAAPGWHGWTAVHPDLHVEMVRAFIEDRPLPAALRRLEATPSSVAPVRHAEA